MLPAPRLDRPSLADVLESCFSAVRSEPNRLGLPPVTKSVVVLVDGLGAAALKARAGHARTLAGSLTAASVLDSGFPTTTAAALASLTTGVAPGQHGLVGYSVLDAANDRVVNQLSGWDARMDPLAWQTVQTVFERAVEHEVDAVVIGPERYRDSGFTHAVLRGARYLAAATIAQRTEAAARWLREPGSGIAYVYVPELDSIGHARGWESPEWTARLETLDAAVATLIGSLRATDGLLVTADHGILDIPAHALVHYDLGDGLLDGVRHVAGEPRCLQLYTEEGQTDAAAAAWRESEGERSWVVTRDEAIDAGWFGAVRDEVRPRIGNVLVAARKNIAYYDSRSSGDPMVGHHGSFSPAEVQVPLLRFGAFAR
jgi:Type I phosphodiesterase / nucleotide pyrophosphatase